MNKVGSSLVYELIYSRGQALKDSVSKPSDVVRSRFVAVSPVTGICMHAFCITDSPPFLLLLNFT